MTTSVVIDGARTPIGKMLGAFASLSGVDLGAVAIKGALERAGVGADQVDAVIFGQVYQAGAGPNPARQAAMNAGIPAHATAFGINQLCGSGLRAALDVGVHALRGRKIAHARKHHLGGFGRQF